MTDEQVFIVNSRRGLFLGLAVICIGIIVMLITGEKMYMLFILLFIALWLNDVIAKKLTRVTLFHDQVRFEYMHFFLNKIMTCNRSEIIIKIRTEVHFRGGKKEVLEIINISSKKRLFEVSKRIFQRPSDYEKLITNLSKG